MIGPMKAKPLPRRITPAMARLVVAVVAGVFLAAGSAQAAALTYTVDSTADTNLTTCNVATANDCTLRGAINAANANPGTDTIDFAIPGTGVQTITSSTALPVITDPVTINGYSQPGASANTQTVAQGDNAVLLIELTGSQSALVISGGASSGGSGTTIRGLAANDAALADQIQIDASNVTIAGNFIGLDPTGTTAKPSGNFGIRQESQHSGEVTDGNTIGGSADADRNVISGNPGGGIILVDGGPTVVRGNYIGPNAAGTAALTPNGLGLDVLGGTPFTVNNTSIVGNLISGNGGPGTGGGIAMNSGGVIQGNLIGTQRDGTTALGNGNFGGIHLGLNDPVTVGGTSTGDANTIAFNANNGVSVGTNSSMKAILGNSIYANGEDDGGLGISLLDTSTFPLANDTGDGDSVPGNLGQNYPDLMSGSISAGQAHVSGTLNSTDSTTFQLEFFANTACNTPSSAPGAPAGDFGEGQTFLGSSSVTTDTSGNASFGPLSFADPSGQATITATATDPSGNTSEFSECLNVPTANTPPTANDDSYTATENQTLNVAAPGVLANDTDPEQDPLTAVKVSDPAHGSVTLNSDGSFAYTPDAGYSGPDSFTYQANDGTANSNTATVSLNVQPVNQPPPSVNQPTPTSNQPPASVNQRPTARDDSYRTDENKILIVSAPGTLKNDSDLDHDRLTAHRVSGPKHGSLILRSDGSLRYVPRHGFSGSDSFTYKVSDGRGAVSNTATAHLTVRPRLFCVVPQLLHATLAESKQLLRRHHCALGKVKGARHGTVASFSPRAGAVRVAGARVRLRLAAIKPHVPTFTG
jgi:CSLREA domain-containing protein